MESIESKHHSLRLGQWTNQSLNAPPLQNWWFRLCKLMWQIVFAFLSRAHTNMEMKLFYTYDMHTDEHCHWQANNEHRIKEMEVTLLVACNIAYCPQSERPFTCSANSCV